jgi:CIC family chloride channel protein
MSTGHGRDAATHDLWFQADQTGGWWLALVVPVVGGLLLGLWHWVIRDRHGAGVDPVIDAFHNRQGKLPGRLAVTKLVSTTISVGTGGSGGREGPIALIGAAAGSWLAGRFNLTVRERRILLAAGLGAGVGGMFRSPLAGGLLAAEMMYSDSEFEADVLVPSIIASVVAYCVFGLFLGFDPIFGKVVAGYVFDNPLELIPLTALAAAMVAGGFLFVWMYRRIAKWLAPVPAMLRPALGALLTGLAAVGAWIALGYRGEGFALLGDGYELLVGLFSAKAGAVEGAWLLFLAIAVGKMMSSSFTLGSGGATGSFAPSMMIGACLGASVGLVLRNVVPAHWGWMPDLNAGETAAAFAMVGMAGFYSGVAKAPIATIIMVSELTGSYHLLLPTLWVGALTFLGSRFYRLHRPQVSTRLQSPAHRGDFAVNVLEAIRIRDVLGEIGVYDSVDEGMPLRAILAMTTTRQSYYPVVNKSGEFVGVFSLNDVRAVLDQQDVWELLVAADIARTEVLTLSPDETLADVSMKFAATSLEELPVVEGGKLVGLISRRQLNNAYIRRMMDYEGAKRAEQTRVMEKDNGTPGA